MFFSLFFLSVIVTTFIHFSVADISLDPDNTNLFFDSDNNQLPSGGSSLWDADVGLGDPTFLTDSDPILFNNDQTDSFELAEVGDFCNAPPSKRARRDTAPNVCPPSGRQGQDQAIVNQLTIPNLLDIFSLKPKKKAPFTEPLGNPPFGASPTGEDGNPCPAERPVHLCCLDTNMRWAEVAGLHINYFTLKFCLAAGAWGSCYYQNEYESCCKSTLPEIYRLSDGSLRSPGLDCIVIKYPANPVAPF